MGLLNKLMGNASEVDMEKLEHELQEILASEERIQTGYSIVRDFFVFTDKRLIMVDKQGITGNKAEYHSIPYKSIRHFSVETAGTFDADAELKLWVAGLDTPLEKEFGKSSNIINVQKTLAEYVL